MRTLKKFGIYSLAICLCLLMALSTVGCSTPTPEELIKDVHNNISNVSSFEGNMKMDLDLNMGMGGTEIPFTTKLDVNIKSNTTPPIIHMNGNMDMKLFGGTTKGTIESYITADNENIITYTKAADDSSWSKTISDGTTSSSSDVLNMMSGITISDAKYTLEGEEKYNDADVYVLKATLSYDQVKSILSSSYLESSAISSELTSENYDYSKFNPTVTMYVYKDSRLPAKVSIDMAKAFEDLMDSLSGSTPDEANESDSYIKANKFLVEMSFSNFNKTEKIEIPANVLKSAEGSSTLSTAPVKEEATVSE